jgi:hypothetical protein
MSCEKVRKLKQQKEKLDYPLSIRSYQRLVYQMHPLIEGVQFRDGPSVLTENGSAKSLLGCCSSIFGDKSFIAMLTRVAKEYSHSRSRNRLRPHP